MSFTPSAYERTLAVGLLWALPLLVFSYAPLVQLGVIQGVHIDVSLLYIVLALIGLASIPAVIRHRRRILSSWLVRLLLLFSSFVSLSVLWTPNTFRGLAVAGFFWLITLVVSVYQLYGPVLFSKRRTIERILGTAFILLCVVALYQIFGDALSVPHAYLLLPEAYTSSTFGVARPVAFALEPQFFASLLLVPYFWTLYRFTKNSNKLYIIGFIASVVLLTLTLSRGGLLAAATGTLVLVVALRPSWRQLMKMVGGGLIGVIASLLIVFTAATLNNRDDISGTAAVRGVVSQLSFGRIAANVIDKDAQTASSLPATTAPGYVASSTDSRLSMSESALDIWRTSPTTILVGVGSGGFGATLAERNENVSVGSVVNNAYLELLAETGLVGLGLFIAILMSVLFQLARYRNYFAFAVLIAFCVQWLFFSGSANVLHIWIFMAIATGIGHAYSVHPKQKSDTIHPDAT